MGNEYSKEINLAADLKAVCNEDGREIDIAKSAPIFHQFGLLYRNRSQDKISLIRSAVLFNAALARQPTNDQIHKDLEELCLHVSQHAGIKQQNEKLIAISVKTQNKIAKMRKESKEKLSKLQIIPVGLPLSQLRTLKVQKVVAIRKLQAKITNSFISIMNNVSSACVKLMGKPPCRYAIVGMGSLARQEITPYSDFEHVIVLEEGVQDLPNYIDILEYFRWFSVIFHIIIINLGETIIPSVSIPLLNNPNIPGGDWFFDCHTTRGISFDGMMLHACKFPLGRTQPTTNKPFTTELIKPVSEMAKYLQADEDIKNGYHLADILTRTCFVSGNKNLYKKFECLAKSVLDCDIESNVKQIRSQLQTDLQTYDVGETIHYLGTSAKWNIKRVIYRSSTLFVSALGRLHFINKGSCFDIIEELLAQRKIGEKTAEKLSFAIAVACETRLKVYMSKQSQNDGVGNRNFFTYENKITQQLCVMIGEQSLGDYFLTARKFQLFLRKSTWQSNMHLESLPHEKFVALFMLDLHDLILAEWQRYTQNENFEIHSVVCYYVAWTYIRNNKFEKALAIYNDLEDAMEFVTSFDAVELQRRKAYCLCELKQYEEGLLYIQKCISEILSHFYQGLDFHAIGYLYALEGDCKRHLCFLDEAIKSYSLAVSCIINSHSLYRKNLQAKCCFFMGHCFFQRNMYSDALESAKIALELCEGSHIEISLECKCNRLLGECNLRLNQPQTALHYFEKELKFYSRQITDKEEKYASDPDLVILLDRIQEATDKLKL